MKELFIVTPSKNKLALSLAYSGNKLFNAHFVTPIELAKLINIRSGLVCEKQFITNSEELAYYGELINSVAYFKTNKLSDIKSINSTINTIRKLIVSDERASFNDVLSKGIFKEKNDALIDVYNKYQNKLNDDNKIDGIGLVRFTIQNATKQNVYALVLDEYKLQPLEYELVNKVCEQVKEVSLFDLYNVKKDGVKVNSYKNCYGSSNEVACILDDILKNKNLDECVIACGDYSTYTQIIFDYAQQHKIPTTFGGGLPVVYSYPGKLLQQYYRWSSQGSFGWQPFEELISSDYFDFALLDSLIDIQNKKDKAEFYKRLAKLRLTNSVSINKERIDNFKQAIARKDINDNGALEKFVFGFEIIAKELALPIEEFINKYAVIRSEDELLISLDNSSKSAIINEIKTIKNMGLDIDDDIASSLLRKMVCKNINKPGHLHVTNINDALMCLRKDLYICGMSSSTYPGSPIENPLLLDSDLNDFGNDQLTSNGKIKQKRETLISLVMLASALHNNIYISYPGLNVSELKNNNASSLLFELYKLENGNDKSLADFNKAIKKVAYFEHDLSANKYIGTAYNQTKEIVYKAINDKNNEKTILDIGKYSPSALNTFFNCKKQFFYQYLLKLNVPDDYDPYEVISASEQGTLAHALMEYLADHKMSKEDFSKLASQCFDEYMNISVPLIKEKIQNVKDEFVEMLENGWQMDNDNPRKLAFKEEDKDAVHKESGIVIHGYPDRVELDENGKAVIVDFKTERSKDKHIENDIDTCLQVAIYAYIVENTMGLDVDHCEYRLLRFNKGIVTCKYDEQIKEELNKKLIEFKEALQSGDFEIEPMNKEDERTKCKYCKFNNICGKVVLDE